MPRYDEHQVKASHNSYSKQASLAEQLEGDPQVPGAVPCGGLELDLVQAEDRLEWQVAHRGPFDEADPAKRLLSDWLVELREWAEGHPDHEVVTIHLDLKNAPRGASHAEYAAGLDEYLTRAVGRDRIYGPADLIGGAPDLVRAGRAGGWPPVELMRGKLVFCLSGRPKRKQRYAEQLPRERLCFVDRSWARWDRPPPERGHWLFLNVLVTNRKPRWQDLGGFLSTRGFVVRGFNIVNADRWRQAKAEGIHFLSTDVLRDPDFTLSS